MIHVIPNRVQLGPFTFTTNDIQGTHHTKKGSVDLLILMIIILVNTTTTTNERGSHSYDMRVR